MSSYAQNKALVTKIATRIAAQADEPVWQNIHEEQQREYLAQAIGLLDLVDESASDPVVATALCAHCIDIIPTTNPRCPCHDWPLCGRCRPRSKTSAKKKAR